MRMIGWGWKGGKVTLVSTLSWGVIQRAQEVSDTLSSLFNWRTGTKPYPSHTRALPEPYPSSTWALPKPYPSPTQTLPEPYPNPSWALPEPYLSSTRALPKSYPSSTWALPDPYPSRTRALPELYPSRTLNRDQLYQVPALAFHCTRVNSVKALLGLERDVKRTICLFTLCALWFIFC